MKLTKFNKSEGIEPNSFHYNFVFFYLFIYNKQVNATHLAAPHLKIKMKNTVNNIRSRMKAPSVFEMTLLGEGKGNGESSSQEAVQVEPKTYFANERTFIQWISAALLLLTVSSIMMGSGGYNGTSSVIAFASLVLVGYASFVYFRRVRLLRSGNAYGYLDHVGPTILAVGVGLGVFIVFADAVKGSEFLPWGNGEKDKDDRRFLMSPSTFSQEAPQMLQESARPFEEVIDLQEMEGKCSRYPIDGINLLEYQPRDIILEQTAASSKLIVATPQSLVSHPLSDTASAFLSEIPDAEIQSMTVVGDRLFALSTGPSKTELIELNNSEIESRFLIQDSASTTGSMTFVPSTAEGKFLIYLDGTMHSYHLPSKNISSAVLSRMGSINMKVLNHGLLDNDDPISSMEHFEGITYVLRERQNMIEAWDLNTATLLAEMALPTVSKNDKWVGMAFERRQDVEGKERKLRKSKVAAATESVYLHMPLDTFPPQLWSFRLEEQERNILSFPECGVATN